MPYPSKKLNLKLFQVTSPEGKKSYFLGTCHQLPLNKGNQIFHYISPILEQAEIIAIEQNPNPGAKKNKPKFNQTIKEYLGEEIYEECNKLSPLHRDLVFATIQEQDIPVELFMLCFPSQLLSENLCLSYCLDEEIMHVAKERLVFLATLQKIQELLKQIEPSLRMAYYKETINCSFKPNNDLEQIQELQDAYLYLTMTDFENLIIKQDQIAMNNLDPRLIQAEKAFQNVLIEQRNKIMLNSFFHFPKDKTVFIAVGAAHLPGMFKILKDKNYTIVQLDCNNAIELRRNPDKIFSKSKGSHEEHNEFERIREPDEYNIRHAQLEHQRFQANASISNSQYHFWSSGQQANDEEKQEDKPAPK